MVVVVILDMEFQSACQALVNRISNGEVNDIVREDDTQNDDRNGMYDCCCVVLCAGSIIRMIATSITFI